MINPDGQHGGVFQIWKQLSVHDTLHFQSYQTSVASSPFTMPSLSCRSHKETYSKNSHVSQVPCF